MSGWEVLSQKNIKIRSWSDEGGVVVYNGFSGDTHLVSSLSGEVLRLLMMQPRTSKMLFHDLSDVFEGHDGDHALDIIESVLSELKNIHLISNLPNAQN